MSLVLEERKTEKRQKIKFICPAGYNLQLVMSSAGRFKEVDGHAIPEPFHHINFRKEGYLPDGVKTGHGFWRGVYVTDDPKEIEFIKSYEGFREGPPPEPRYENGLPVNESAGGTNRLVYAVPFVDQKPQPGPSQVERFGERENILPEPSAPPEEIPNPTKAKISKRLRR